MFTPLSYSFLFSLSQCHHLQQHLQKVLLLLLQLIFETPPLRIIGYRHQQPTITVHQWSRSHNCSLIYRTIHLMQYVSFSYHSFLWSANRSLHRSLKREIIQVQRMATTTTTTMIISTTARVLNKLCNPFLANVNHTSRQVDLGRMVGNIFSPISFKEDQLTCSIDLYR